MSHWRPFTSTTPRNHPLFRTITPAEQRRQLDRDFRLNQALLMNLDPAIIDDPPLPPPLDFSTIPDPPRLPQPSHISTLEVDYKHKRKQLVHNFSLFTEARDPRVTEKELRGYILECVDRIKCYDKKIEHEYTKAQLEALLKAFSKRVRKGEFRKRGEFPSLPKKRDVVPEWLKRKSEGKYSKEQLAGVHERVRERRREGGDGFPPGLPEKLRAAIKVAFSPEELKELHARIERMTREEKKKVAQLRERQRMKEREKIWAEAIRLQQEFASGEVDVTGGKGGMKTGEVVGWKRGDARRRLVMELENEKENEKEKEKEKKDEKEGRGKKRKTDDAGLPEREVDRKRFDQG
ncbi:hypothetical protein K440DRAFT_675753 [Wilcoxina mikolae CBS 423.85]|nr:hypothetical protein K440DRAFT_675753 [Wilcoxina mikolae CBS 423.85]